MSLIHTSDGRGETMNSPDALFLGFDSSTQGLKVIAIDAECRTAYERAINFDSDLPEFETQGGVHHGDDGLTVTSPPKMWVAALDLLLQQMKDDSFEFARVVAVSGSGQQHGSVYLKRDARAQLQGLRAGSPLRDQLSDLFTVEESPIWMDSSTAEQCRSLEEKLGGAQAVAELTGSRAYERFTGNQIAKISQVQQNAYDATERIALVSSFIASVLSGDYAPIDASDGSGMNLMDVRAKTWSSAALDATAPGLEEKLGDIVASHVVVGKIHQYFCDTWGFAADCDVVAFSGDNPCSLAGLRLQRPGDVAISLGTSDTVFGSLSEPAPSATEGHVFANPVDPEGYMAMVCYKNGSLTREDVRDMFGGGTWKSCAEAVGRTPVGNNGRIAFYVKEPEITPPIMKTGTYRFDEGGTELDAFPPDADPRAVIEGQFLSMRLHGANIGLRPASILATGGASGDMSLIRIMSDVFGVPVYTGESPSSAALGAAYRALHGWKCAQAGSFVPFADVLTSAPSFKLTAKPDPEAHATYSGMLGRYAELETRIVDQ
jgi:xylulokinase